MKPQLVHATVTVTVDAQEWAKEHETTPENAEDHLHDWVTETLSANPSGSLIKEISQ